MHASAVPQWIWCRYCTLNGTGGSSSSRPGVGGLNAPGDMRKREQASARVRMQPDFEMGTEHTTQPYCYRWQSLMADGEWHDAYGTICSGSDEAHDEMTRLVHGMH